MSQPESRLSRKIINSLRAHNDVFVFKQWGNERVMAGLPDILGCVAGRFFALEVKMPERRSNVSAIQQLRHEQIRAAGGFVVVVCSVAEAEKALENCRSGLKQS